MRKNAIRKILKVAVMLCLALMQIVVNFTTNVRAEEAVGVANGLKFFAVNPGYTVDGVGNVGEMILLKNTLGGSLSLAGFSIKYINSSGNASLLLQFSPSDEMTREDLLLRLASTHEPADLSYSKTLAMKGALELFCEGVLVDRICWNGGEGCEVAFNSDHPSALIRDFGAAKLERVAVEDYALSYDEKSGVRLELTGGRGEAEEDEALEPASGDEEPASGDEGPAVPPAGGEADEAPRAHCQGLAFSEILSYYESDKSEQFIEIFNAGDEQIRLDGCGLKYKNKLYPLAGILAPGKYLTYAPDGFTLTKNPNSQNEVVLVDEDGSQLDSLVYYNGQKKGVAMAWFGYDESGAELWLATYAPTPGEENDYQKFKTCPEGKVINEETGNCVKATAIDTSLAECPTGKYRNPLTGRCKSYPSASSNEQKECAEGYERNPETNRCRKIKTNTGADYPLGTGEMEVRVNFVAMAGIIVVVAIGVAYVIWQFRKEIAGVAKKAWKKLRGKLGQKR